MVQRMELYLGTYKFQRSRWYIRVLSAQNKVPQRSVSPSFSVMDDTRFVLRAVRSTMKEVVRVVEILQ